MAVRKIAFPVVCQQNLNVQSEAYGKYYPRPFKPAFFCRNTMQSFQIFGRKA